MRSLFIDTSNSSVSIAIVDNGKILGSVYEEIPNMHSVYVVPYVEMVFKASCIDYKDIDNIMVVNGPGSFTGIRIGLTVAKVMGYLLNKEIIPVSSLKSLALSCTGNYVMSVIPARNDNYYIGVYDMFYNSLCEEHFASSSEIELLKNRYKDILVVSFSSIDSIGACKSTYDVLKIVNYYKDEKGVNAFSVKCNYLKLPQAVSDLK